MEIKIMGVLGCINTPINIQTISHLDKGTNHNFPQVCIKLEDNITACVYKSGKVQIYGIKDIKSIQYYWDIVLDIIKNYVDVSNADKSPSLKFIVVLEKLPFTINLKKVTEVLIDENIEYEPEQFPGLIWRLNKGTCLLFSTGSCIINGANSLEIVKEIISEIKIKLEYTNNIKRYE